MPKIDIHEKAVKAVEQRTTYTYTPETKQQALAMHLHLCSVAQISNKLGIPKDTVYDWVKSNEWTKHKDQVINSLYGNLYRRRQGDMEEIIGMGLGVLKRRLAEILTEEEKIDVKEMQRLMTIISDANKMLRLEEGKPTDITKNISLKEAKKHARKIFENDPFKEFSNVVEVEDIEVISD